MRNNPYDLFAKDCLELLLEDAGRVQRALEVAVPAQVVDAAFTPSPRGLAKLRGRGLLGRLARRRCAWECFHDAPSLDDLRDLARKHLAWHHLLMARARRRKKGATVALPPLYVVCAARPTQAIRAMQVGAVPALGAGFYVAAGALVGLHIIVVDELPRRRATLPLRLLGRGAALAEALDEVARLPRRSWERKIRGAVVQFKKRLSDGAGSSEMGRLAEQIKAYEEKLIDRGERRGLRKGRVEGRVEALQSLVEVRLGRTLTPREHRALLDKAGSLGAAAFTRAVLEREPAALATWLTARAARSTAA